MIDLRQVGFNGIPQPLKRLYFQGLTSMSLEQVGLQPYPITP